MLRPTADGARYDGRRVHGDARRASAGGNAPVKRARAEYLAGKRTLVGCAFPSRLSPVTSDSANDRAHNLVELRRLADKVDGPGVSRAVVEASLRNNADALTFRARLRRSGMSDAEITAALFGPPHADEA